LSAPILSEIIGTSTAILECFLICRKSFDTKHLGLAGGHPVDVKRSPATTYVETGLALQLPYACGVPHGRKWTCLQCFHGVFNGCYGVLELP